MPHPPYVTRLANFNQDALAALESPEPLKVDSELNQLVALANLLNLRVRNITNSDGTLRNQSTATAQALAGAERFVATASQTVFLTAIAWQASFTALNVEAFSGGVRIDSSLISVANSGGFLQVTLPAQTVSTVVLIAAFESGAGILTRLGTAGSATDGANLVALRDVAGWFVSSTVEGALQELGSDLDSLTTSLGSIGGLIRADGTVPMAAALAMGGFKVTGLANGTAAQDAVTVSQLSAYTAVWNALQSYFLRLDGTTPMAASLPMGSNKITGMLDGTAAQDAVTVTQLGLKLSLTGGTMSGAIAMGTSKITGLGPGTAGTDAVNKNQLDAVASAASGFSTVLADLTTAGLTNVVIPAGVAIVMIEAWGGGGGGDTAAFGPAGGSAGGAVRTFQAVAAGDTLNCTVGSGGAAGSDGTNSTVVNGASTLCTAQKGLTSGAQGAVSTFLGTNGVQFYGGKGGPGNGGAIYFAGPGGHGAMGGGQGGTWAVQGLGGAAGQAPAGGGAGGFAGAAGRIIVRY